MVNIDTVYQKVLALANKEQRGYITPQEFNLFADQAQIEIFEQYFYDTNQSNRQHGNDTVFADVSDMLEEKMQLFQFFDGSTQINDNTIYVGVGPADKILPDYIYRVVRVERNGSECEMMNTQDFNDAINGGPLTRPTEKRPIVNIRGRVMRCSTSSGVVPTDIIYFRRPLTPQWGYVVITSKALYDPNPTKTTHFELHGSEESELVYRILALAGISINKPGLTQVAAGLEQAKVQQEKQ